MIPALLIPVALLAGYVVTRPKRRQKKESGMGWTAKSAGTTITPKMIDFLDRLAGLVSFPFVVTSGRRSPRSQAAAMIAKIDAGTDDQEMSATYGHSAAIRELLTVQGRDARAAGWPTMIASQIARGMFISSHLRDDGIDLRTRDLTSDQADELVSVAHALGVRVAFREGEPSHIHITLSDTSPHA